AVPRHRRPGHAQRHDDGGRQRSPHRKATAPAPRATRAAAAPTHIPHWPASDDRHVAATPARATAPRTTANPAARRRRPKTTAATAAAASTGAAPPTTSAPRNHHW